MQNSLTFEIVDITSLVRDRKLRRHSARQLAQLQVSLTAYGQARPIVISASGRVLDGDLICDALIANEETKVSAVRINDLSEDEAAALAIQLRAASRGSSWNLPTLIGSLESLASSESLMPIGLDVSTLESLLAKPVEILRHDQPIVSTSESVWTCGHHKLSCGSLDEPNRLLRLLDGRRAASALFVLDQSTSDGLHNGVLPASNPKPNLAELLNVLRGVSMPNAVIIVAAIWDDTSAIMEAAQRASLIPVDLCVQPLAISKAKGFYRNKIVLLHFLTRRDADSSKMARVKNRATNLWSGARTAGSLSLLSRRAVDRVIADTSEIGDTIIASAEHLQSVDEGGRILIAIDSDVGVIDGAVRAWQNQTGQIAVDHRTGKTFDETATSMGQRK